MARNTYLTKEAKEFILTQMHERGEMTTDDVVELIRPHYLFDPVASKEQQMKRKAYQLMSTVRDDTGVRTCFAIKKHGESVYINVDKSENFSDVSAVERQLLTKLTGLTASHEKAARKKHEIVGQTSLFGFSGNQALESAE